MDKRCICSDCLRARAEANVRTTYEAHRERIGVRASIDATARDTNLSADVVGWILGFDRLPGRPT